MMRSTSGRALHVTTLLLAAALGGNAAACAPKPEAKASAFPKEPPTKMPVLISGKVPEYTKEALDAGVEGPVEVRCLITKAGEVTKCKMLKSLPHMDQAVLDAVATWRCEPASRGGAPVEMQHVFKLRLKLPRELKANEQPVTGPVPFDASKMTRPELVIGKDPVYTEEALARRVQGKFVARCTITTQGQVTNCRVITPLPFMTETILNTLTQRVYKPARLNGEPVNVDYVFNVLLVLPQQ